MDVYNQLEHKLPTILTWKSLTLQCCSFLEWGGDRIAECFCSKSWQNIGYASQRLNTWIISISTTLQIGDAPLTLILWMVRWPCCCFFCLYKLPIHRLCVTATKSLVKYRTHNSKNHWHSVGTYFNALSIQYLLPSIIVCIMIWTNSVLFWPIENWPWGKA
jgi:hypothetical protein